MPRIHIIHQKDEWIEPLRMALRQRRLPFAERRLDEVPLDLDATSPAGIFYNRMSASAHLDGVGLFAERTEALLDHLEGQGRRVVNGSRAWHLAVSKVAQLAALNRCGIRTPRTLAAAGPAQIVAAAEHFDGPLIVKHNRGGRGSSVRLFDDRAALRDWAESPDFDDSPDGLTLVQEYIEAPEPFITRLDFVGGRLFYAVRVETGRGFELCPADHCRINEDGPKFEIVAGFEHPMVERYQAFLRDNRIEIGAVEFIQGGDGTLYTYDINPSGNYNSLAESAAGVSAMGAIADYLGDQLEAAMAASAAAGGAGRDGAALPP